MSVSEKFFDQPGIEPGTFRLLLLKQFKYKLFKKVKYFLCTNQFTYVT